MASSSCTNMAKCLLIFTGVCYLASAGGISYIGIWVFDSYDHFDEIADSTLTLLPASIILALSAFMCIIGILACIAAFKNHKILLSVFFCLILFVLLGEVLTAVLGYVYRSKLEGVLNDDLTEAINSFNESDYFDQINRMQKKFQCCGIHNASDWFESDYWKQNHTNTVPESCCKPVSGNQTCIPTIGSDTINDEGCLDKLESLFRKNLIYIAAASVFLALIQFLALISTCILVCRTRKETNYQTLMEEVGGGLRI